MSVYSNLWRKVCQGGFLFRATGILVVQLAKNVIGAGRVVAIAGSDEKCDYLKEIGADAAV